VETTKPWAELVYQGPFRSYTTRNLLARAPKAQQSRLATLPRGTYRAPSAEKSHAAGRAIADQARTGQ
jgi:hypothetical protein